MGSNEKKTVIIKFPRFFAQFPIVLEESHCLVFCQLNFYLKAVNFHKILNQLGWVEVIQQPVRMKSINSCRCF